jgi:Fe-S-cluster-containing dehydrogenase component
MGLLIDSEVCNACRMCELACSFHHEGVFSPHDSSVKVTSDFKEGKIRLSIDATCDLCPQEPQPLCLQYCLTGALKKEGANERK